MRRANREYWISVHCMRIQARNARRSGVKCKRVPCHFLRARSVSSSGNRCMETVRKATYTARGSSKASNDKNQLMSQAKWLSMANQAKSACDERRA